MSRKPKSGPPTLIGAVFIPLAALVLVVLYEHPALAFLGAALLYVSGFAFGFSTCDAAAQRDEEPSGDDEPRVGGSA